MRATTISRTDFTLFSNPSNTVTQPSTGNPRLVSASPNPRQGPLSLTDQASIGSIQVDLAQQARRELLILTRDLDPGYFDRIPFIKAVRQLSLTTSRLPVRVLLLEPRLPVSSGHRLISLARQFTSRIGIRRLAQEFRERPDAFLVADGRGYCRRPLAQVHEAAAEMDGPLEARRLRADFQQMWERSEEDVDLRRLHI